MSERWPYSFNPWLGCSKVSPGCDHCYAEAILMQQQLDVFGPNQRRLAPEKAWDEVSKLPSGQIVLNTLCDLFEKLPSGRMDGFLLDRARSRLWKLCESTPHLIWHFLTRRPENACQMVPDSWAGRWPDNARLGVSVENQNTVDVRLAALKGIPVTRFITVEPMLEPVVLPANLAQSVDWVCCEFECGPNARSCLMEWVDNLQAQCNASGVHFCMPSSGRISAELDWCRPGYVST